MGATGEDSRPALMGLTREQINTAMKDPEHLKRWLRGTGRQFVVLNSSDLVDALWGVGDAVDLLIQILAAYRDHRAAQPSGRTEMLEEPVSKKMVEVPIPKGEQLELEEMDRCVRWMIGQASALDESWSLDNPAL